MGFIVTASEQLGPTLQGLRRNRKITQSTVAANSGLRQKTVSLLETEPRRCSVDSLVRYLAAVGVSLSLAPATATSNPSKTDAW